MLPAKRIHQDEDTCEAIVEQTHIQLNILALAAGLHYVEQKQSHTQQLRVDTMMC